MIIGIDLRPLQDGSRYRGIGYYVRNVVREIIKLRPDYAYKFYAYSGDIDLEPLSLPAELDFEFVPLAPYSDHELTYKLKSKLRQPIVIESSELDVYFQTDISYGLPRTQVPVVSVIYDLIPLLFKEKYQLQPRLEFSSPTSIKEFGVSRLIWWLYTSSLSSACESKSMVAISTSSMNDYLRFYDYDPTKITVTPLAHNTAFHPMEQAKKALKKRFDLTGDFIMYTGGCDFRKNIVSLVSAFDRLRDQGIQMKLVLAGKDFISSSDPNQPRVLQRIMESPWRQDILLPGYVATNDLPLFYSACTAFVYPTLYEGFGLPILEAMACGCPVIAYRNSSIPEVAGHAALLINEQDDLAEAISLVATSPSKRSRMIKAGLAQSKKFTWEKTARNTLKVLEEAA